MNSVVIDASVAIKWILPQPDTNLAEALIGRYRMVAPQLIYAECANIVWKKVRRGEMNASEARVASTFINDFAIETASMAEIVPLAIDLSIRIDHPAYDCFYLALALLEQCPMVTADESFCRKVRQRLGPDESERCVTLSMIAAEG